MAHVRIECDGDSKHLRVFDIDSGQQIPFVKRVEWTVQYDKPTTEAVITVMLTQADLMAEATIVGECPHCGHVSPLVPTPSQESE